MYLGQGMVFLRFKLIFSWKELSQNIIQKLLKMLQDSNTSLRISAGLTDSRVTVIQVLRGVILEGGELGYSLSTSYGAILDNPNLIAACLVGDGEAETGPTATAWHLNKFISPKINGAVLPILHLNGYKISAQLFLEE